MVGLDWLLLAGRLFRMLRGEYATMKIGGYMVMNLYKILLTGLLRVALVLTTAVIIGGLVLVLRFFLEKIYG